LIYKPTSGIESNMSSNQIQNASAAPGIERRKHSRHRFIVDLNISSENGTSMHGIGFEIGAGGMSAATAGRLEGRTSASVPGNTSSREGHRPTKKRVNAWL
jgi:hypothetical protein